jgi:hypothetical protein
LKRLFFFVDFSCERPAAFFDQETGKLAAGAPSTIAPTAAVRRRSISFPVASAFEAGSKDRQD